MRQAQQVSTGVKNFQGSPFQSFPSLGTRLFYHPSIRHRFLSSPWIIKGMEQRGSNCRRIEGSVTVRPMSSWYAPKYQPRPNILNQQVPPTRLNAASDHISHVRIRSMRGIGGIVEESRIICRLVRRRRLRRSLASDSFAGGDPHVGLSRRDDI